MHNLNLKHAIFGLLLALLAAAWFLRYELREDKSGAMVRLDRLSGQVAVVKGNRLTIVQTQQEPMERKPRPTTPRTWDAVALPTLGDVRVNVKSMWRDEKILYQVSVAPFSEKIKAAMGRSPRSAQFIILFDDANGFEVTRVNVPLADVTRLVDEQGKPLSIELKGSQPLSYDSYKDVVQLDLQWAGFN